MPWERRSHLRRIWTSRPLPRASAHRRKPRTTTNRLGRWFNLQKAGTPTDRKHWYLRSAAVQANEPLSAAALRPPNKPLLDSAGEFWSGLCGRLTGHPCDVDGTISDGNGSPTDDHPSRLPSAARRIARARRRLIATEHFGIGPLVGAGTPRLPPGAGVPKKPFLAPAKPFSVTQESGPKRSARSVRSYWSNNEVRSCSRCWTWFTGRIAEPACQRSDGSIWPASANTTRDPDAPSPQAWRRNPTAARHRHLRASKSPRPSPWWIWRFGRAAHGRRQR